MIWVDLFLGGLSSGRSRTDAVCLTKTEDSTGLSRAAFTPNTSGHRRETKSILQQNFCKNKPAFRKNRKPSSCKVPGFRACLHGELWPRYCQSIPEEWFTKKIGNTHKLTPLVCSQTCWHVTFPTHLKTRKVHEDLPRPLLGLASGKMSTAVSQLHEGEGSPAPHCAIKTWKKGEKTQTHTLRRCVTGRKRHFATDTGHNSIDLMNTAK